MSNRYWGALFAAIGLAFISFGFGAMLVASNYPEQERYPGYRQTQGDPARADAALVNRSQTLEYRKPCEQPEGSDESDLCAQWKAARAAEASALWTRLTFWLGVVGVFVTIIGTALLIRTLRQNDQALTIARTSSEESRKIGEAQVRAYLGVTGGVLKWNGTDFHVELTFRNSGQSPALNPAFQVFLTFKEITDYKHEFMISQLFPESYQVAPLSSVGAGDSYTTPFYRNPIEFTYEVGKIYSADFLIYVIYKDVFGNILDGNFQGSVPIMGFPIGEANLPIIFFDHNYDPSDFDAYMNEIGDRRREAWEKVTAYETAREAREAQQKRKDEN
jgi:hypothetical protein